MNCDARDAEWNIASFFGCNESFLCEGDRWSEREKTEK